MKITPQPLARVITPIYMGEPYLAECIESVVAQSQTHWEYAIVNNPSTDRSGDIARSYARRDGRIRVHDDVDLLHAIDNWYHALRPVSPDSRYCKVLHADDWRFPDCLMQMTVLAQAHPPVGIVSAYRLAEDRANLDGLPCADTEVIGREIFRRSRLLDQDHLGSPSSVLIHAVIVRTRDPFYTDSNVDTGTWAGFDILQDWDFGFVHQMRTYIRRHNASRTSTAVRFERRRLAKLGRLLAYSPILLDETEFQACQRALLETYYRVLAQRLLELQEPASWKYPTEELGRLGQPLSGPWLAWKVALELPNRRPSLGRNRSGPTQRRDAAAGSETRAAKCSGTAGRPRTHGAF